MRMPAAVYRAFATILPALLGQGLIYLCVTDRMNVITALGAILAIATVTLTAAAVSRSESEQRLVRRNAPPAMFMRRAGIGR